MYKKYEEEAEFRVKEIEIERLMAQFGNDDERFINNWFIPYMKMLKEELPVVEYTPENMEIVKLWEKKHDYEEMMKTYLNDKDTLRKHGQGFLKYYHERVCEQKKSRLDREILELIIYNWKNEEFVVDLRRLMMESQEVLKDRGLRMNPIDERDRIDRTGHHVFNV